MPLTKCFPYLTYVKLKTEIHGIAVLLHAIDQFSEFNAVNHFSKFRCSSHKCFNVGLFQACNSVPLLIGTSPSVGGTVPAVKVDPSLPLHGKTTFRQKKETGIFCCRFSLICFLVSFEVNDLPFLLACQCILKHQGLSPLFTPVFICSWRHAGKGTGGAWW